MWTDQNDSYRAAYVLHFMGGSWLIAAYALDTLSLPGWLWQSAKRPLPPLRVFPWSKRGLFPAYTYLVTATWLLVVLTWTAFVPWSTRPKGGQWSLNSLLVLMLCECVASYVLGGAALWYHERAHAVRDALAESVHAEVAASPGDVADLALTVNGVDENPFDGAMQPE